MGRRDHFSVGGPIVVVREWMQEPPIRFGTGGWRGIVGEEVTPRRVVATATAAARWMLAGGGSRKILLAYDRRRESAGHAQLAASHLTALGATPLLCEPACPTPVVTWRLSLGGLAGAIVFTASHNPPRYNGLKVFDSRGCPVAGSATREIERHATEALRSELIEPAGTAEVFSERDVIADYCSAITSLLDRQAIADAAPSVHYDALHGVGAGVLDRILSHSGADLQVDRGSADPEFGGGPPDPTPERLGALIARVRADAGLSLGLATDGDADRFAVVTEEGSVLTATQALALLVDHLGRAGRIDRGVVISLAAGTLIERVAEHWGVRVRRRAMGFRNLAEELATGGADLAGDESGGFALAAASPDKDGILASCLLVERVAQQREPVGVWLGKLERRFGASACGRTHVVAEPAACDALAKLASDAPARVDGANVRSVDRMDGLHLTLDDGFLMLRRSGTEPVIRVYAEATTAPELERRLAKGRELLLRG